MVLEQTYEDHSEDIVIYPHYSAETADKTLAIKELPERCSAIIKLETQSSITLVEWVDLSPKDGGDLLILKPGQALRTGFGYAPRGPKRKFKQELHLSRQQVERWDRSAVFVNKCEGPDFQSKLPQALHPIMFTARYRSKSLFEQDLVDRPLNLPLASPSDTGGFSWFNLGAKFMGRHVDSQVFSLVATLPPVVYGGVHLSAWNFEFPTKTERLLWKIACFDIMATVPLLLLSCVIWTLLCKSFAKFLLYPCLLFYALSRFYLVVESFVSLRSVPIGVYWTPSWLQMLPHI